MDRSVKGPAGRPAPDPPRGARHSLAPRGSSRPVEGVGRRRAEIVDAAARVFARKGVGNTTMRDIAAESGILAGSLYHHFPSKDALLEEVLRGVLTDLTGAYEEVCGAGLDPESAVEQLMLIGMRFVDDHQDVTSIVQNDFTYLHDVEAFAFIDEFTELHWSSWRCVLERGVAAGVFRRDLDLEIAYRSMMASIVAEVRWRRDRRRRPDAPALAAQYTGMYLTGLAVSAVATNPSS